MKNVLLIIILLNLISTISSHISCCQNTNQNIISCENLALVSVPNCSNVAVTKKLLLGKNDIEKLYNSSFYGFSSLTSLHLNNNQIFHIDINAFENLKYLITLYLNHNSLDHLPDGLFLGLKHLKTIYLHHNNFIRIPIIQSISVNRILFGNNKLNSFHFPKEYLMCRNLKVLDFSNNGINQVSKEDLINLKNCPIETFKIRNNQLSHLETNNFFYIRKKLRNFVISKNVKLQNSGLKKIFNSFDHIRHSETWHMEIYCENIGLSNLTLDLFDSLRNIFLIKLALADNFIKDIETGFGNLKELRQLDLSRNRLSNLKSYQFSMVSNLKILILKDNFIETIDETAFINLDQLKKLDLSNNKLEYLNTLTFANISSLENLILKGNRIVTLSACKPRQWPIMNRFITTKLLTIDSLCFTSKSCDKFSETKIDFGFQVDISRQLCEDNDTELWTSALNIATIDHSNTTSDTSNDTSVLINNTQVQTIAPIISTNSTNNSFVRIMFANISQSRMVVQEINNNKLTLVFVIAISVTLIVFIIIIGVLKKCNSLNAMGHFWKRRCSKPKSIITKQKLSKTTCVDTSSNIYESLPESDITI